jgi:hypothetical protein
MMNEEIELLARDVVKGFRGDHYWIYTEDAIVDVAAAIRAAVEEERNELQVRIGQAFSDGFNTALEEAAVNLEALERGTYTASNSASEMLRAMKVK